MISAGRSKGTTEPIPRSGTVGSKSRVAPLLGPVPARKSRRVRALHRESLLHIPLLAQLFGDPAFAIVRRGVDSRWKYEDVIATRVEGFNPFRGAAFIGTHSHFDRWLAHRRDSARPFNRGDELVSEVLFVAHDYLHAWTYRWIDQLHPVLGVGRRPITSGNFEDMVFCHMLSEAVATVGLDYWYLSTVDLSEEVPIGTLSRGLTVSYHEDKIDEYRRFNPRLNVQHPSYLEQLTRFYCDGVFKGFDIDDVQASPAIESWITHELNYGQLQRRYCRQWFAYLSRDDLTLEDAALAAPVAYGAPWQKRLVAEIAERLWAKVKHGEPCLPDARFDPDDTWAAPARRPADFRFLNLNRCAMVPAAAVKAMPDDSFDHLLRQYAARFDFEAFPEEALGIFDLIRQERDFAIGDRFLADLKRLPVAAAEPRDLFLYN